MTARSVERTWLSALVVNAATLGCGVLTGILAARILAPEGRGALAAVVFWPQLFLTVGLCSLQEAVTYHVSQEAGKRDSPYSTALCVALGLAAVTCVVGYPLLPHLLKQENMAWLPTVRIYLLLYVPIGFVSISLLGIELGKLQFRRFNLYQLVNPLTYLSALLLLWWIHAVTIANVIWASLAGTVSVTLLLLVHLRKTLFRQRPVLSEARGILRTAWRFHATALLVLVTTQVDRFVAITLLDNRSVGLYVAALAIASAGIGIISTSFHTLMFPSIARREKDAQHDYLAKGLRYAMFLIVACSLLLTASIPIILPLLFGPDFRAATVPAMLLVMAYVPLALRQIIIRTLRGIGDAKAGTAAEGISIAIFLSLSWPLTLRWQLNGLSVALLLGNCAALAYLSWHLSERLGISPKRWWGLDVVTLTEAFQRMRSALSIKSIP
jgi:O-antigen/teichoic acid export membrane protein